MVSIAVAFPWPLQNRVMACLRLTLHRLLYLFFTNTACVYGPCDSQPLPPSLQSSNPFALLDDSGDESPAKAGKSTTVKTDAKQTGAVKPAEASKVDPRYVVSQSTSQSSCLAVVRRYAPLGLGHSGSTLVGASHPISSAPWPAMSISHSALTLSFLLLQSPTEPT